LPPTGDEQRSIVAQVRNETAALTAWIERPQREIGLVREYRTRLIADVMRAKVDVRHLASAELPPADEVTAEDLEGGIDDGETLPENDESELVQEIADDVD